MSPNSGQTLFFFKHFTYITSFKPVMTLLRQAWDLGLGPFAAVLAPGQKSPQATKYKEAIRD